jgi:sugar phosphate isomerase/epimerase
MDEVVRRDGEQDCFVRARRLGFSGVEVTLARHGLRVDPERVERLRRAAETTSVAIPSLVLAEHNQGGIADAAADVAAAAAEDVRQAIGWAASLDVDVVLVPFFLRAELVGDADVARCAAAFRALCPLAAERGVTLCYEGLLPAGRIRELARAVDSPAFGCYLDLANPLTRGLDTPTEIRALGELVRRVHVKDTRVRAGDCRPGRGRVDFAECARALQEIGYEGWLTLETPAGPAPLVARDLSFTRAVFGLPAPRWPRFGAFSYDFERGDWDPLVAEFERLGLEAVQLGGKLLAECLDEPDGVPARSALLESHGIAVTALAGYRNLIAPDPVTRQANVDAIRRCLEVAPALGTAIVATETGTRHPGGDWTDSPDNWGETAWRLLDDALATLIPVAERCGVVLALEASVKNVLRTQGQLIGVLDRFPSEHLQVVCDPYNYLSGDLLPAQERVTSELLDRFEDRFVVAHLKDVDEGGADVATPEFGTGVFTQRPYLEFLRDRRPDLDLIVEHLPLVHVPAVVRQVGELLSGRSRRPSAPPPAGGR